MPRDSRLPSPIRLHAGAQLLRSTNRRLDPAAASPRVRTKGTHGADTLDLARKIRERRRAPIPRAARRRTSARRPSIETRANLPITSVAEADRVFERHRFGHPFDICSVLGTLEDREIDGPELDDLLRSLGVDPIGY